MATTDLRFLLSVLIVSLAILAIAFLLWTPKKKIVEPNEFNWIKAVMYISKARELINARDFQQLKKGFAHQDRSVLIHEAYMRFAQKHMTKEQYVLYSIFLDEYFGEHSNRK